MVTEERHRALLIRQNPWWQGKKIEIPVFERDLLSKIQKYIKYKQILAITGLRRVGKTTIIKQVIQGLDVHKKNICYISFDDIDFQKYTVAEDLINYFLEFSDKNKKRYLFLDEIQKLPNWTDLLKTYYDTEDNLKIFLSGSSSLELKDKKETLAGRILTFDLPVLSFSEFSRYFGMEYKPSKNIFHEYDLKLTGKKERYRDIFESYLLMGAFPELLDIKDEEFIRMYIKESVIEKSVADISKAANVDEKIIYELFRLLINSNAQLFEITSISNTLKINRNLVSRCVGLLEKSFLIKTIYNFTGSVAKQVRTNKKQYTAHSSIIIAMLDYPESIIKTEVVGRLVEGIIVNSMDNLAFYRSPQKDEVDIVAKKGKELIPIEVKYQSQITKYDTKQIIKFSKKYNINRAVIVTKNLFDERNMDSVKILFIPAWLFLSDWEKIITEF